MTFLNGEDVELEVDGITPKQLHFLTEMMRVRADVARALSKRQAFGLIARYIEFAPATPKQIHFARSLGATSTELQGICKDGAAVLIRQLLNGQTTEREMQ